MPTRPLALLGVSVLEAARQALLAALEAWRREWGPGADVVEVVCRRAWEAPCPAAWQRTYCDDGRLVCAAWDASFETALQRHLFGPVRDGTVPRPAPFAAACASAAANALADRIAARAMIAASAEAGDQTAFDAEFQDAIRPCSGALIASFRLDGHEMQCLLNHGCVRVSADSGDTSPFADLPPLAGVALEAVLRNAVVPLRVEAGQATVALAGLATLCHGDVIPLQWLLDQPLPVRGPDGTGLFAAYLGKADGKLAIDAACLPKPDRAPDPPSQRRIF